MNPDSLIKILGFFNKPFHYLIAGIVFLMFAEKDWVIWGWLLIGLSIASFLEWLVNLMKEKHNAKKRKIKEQEEKLFEQKNLQQKYDNLNWNEKMILRVCVSHNNIIYRDNFGDEYNEMLALSVKGFGQLKSNDTFILDPECLEWLKEWSIINKDDEL